PVPSEETARAIEAERRERAVCDGNANEPLLAEILAAEAAAAPLIGAIRGVAEQAIGECAAVMKGTASEVIAWAAAENQAQFALFMAYVDGREGGEINGDAIGLVSVGNLLLDASPLKTLVSIVTLGAGFAARDYNRKLAAWRASTER